MSVLLLYDDTDKHFTCTSATTASIIVVTLWHGFTLHVPVM